MNPSEPSLLVDFNNSTDDDVIHVLRTFSKDPSVGQALRLYDREGNSALGYVTAVDERIVSVRVVWETWSDANPIRIVEEIDLLSALRQEIALRSVSRTETQPTDPKFAKRIKASAV